MPTKVRKNIKKLINDKNLLVLLKLLQALGIEFSPHLFDGHYTISAEDVLQLINDREAFEAKIHNIDLATWKKFKHYIRSHRQCESLTKKGRQCENRSRAYNLENFINDGCVAVCNFHKKLTSNHLVI